MNPAGQLLSAGRPLSRDAHGAPANNSPHTGIRSCLPFLIRESNLAGLIALDAGKAAAAFSAYHIVRSRGGCPGSSGILR
jgi:hypothetical protein